MNASQLRAGSTVYDIGGAPLLLDREIGTGGEGTVWSVQEKPELAAKFYHKGIACDHARKLEVMCRLKSESLLKVAAWPISTLSANRASPPVGLLMPRISGYQAAHLLYSPKSRRASFPDAQFPFILHSATNIARAFAAVHDAGQVIGDVNHGNLLVSERATVALIDCDSFEITEGQNVYPCLVGVPTYTPPELQGKSFQEIRRTQQHDAFGLAVLIFHMLFLGRHPFAGIYRNGTADMTIEQAISEYRFAYSPDCSSTQMQPPPSAPRLDDFPSVLWQLFMRAFTRAREPLRRASAHEWIGPLESLSRSLKQCDVNRSHHFSDHLTVCPWCRVEGMAGLALFGVKIVLAGAKEFNLSALWAQIEAIQPPAGPTSTPTSQSFVGTFAINSKIGDIVRKRRMKRLVSVAFIATAIAFVLSAQPAFIISLTILTAGLYGMTGFWKSGQAGAKEFADAYQASMKDYASEVEAWNRIQSGPSGFTETKQSLASARQVFNELPTIRARKLAELNENRRQKQLQLFLESHRIEDAVLPGIGKGRKELLRVYNVEDASDVQLSRINGIKGFGPAMRSTLMAWRALVEQKFRFDPSQGLDPRDVRAMEQELEQKRTDAIRLLQNGPSRLQQCISSWQSQRDHVFYRLAESAKRLAQTEVDMNGLRHW